MSHNACVMPILLVLLGWAAQPATAATGLLARWNLDEGAGALVKDTSGKACNCEVHGAKWASGPTGPVLDFDGTSAYVAVLDPLVGNLSGSFTIAFWMEPYAWADQYSTGIVSKKLDDAHVGCVVYADGTVPTKITLRITGTQGGHGMLTSASDVDENLWQHWAVTYEAASQTLS